MTVRALREDDVGPLAEALAELELMKRYRRTAEAIATDLRTAEARGEEVLVHEGPTGPDGLACFQTTGSFGPLGGYLRLIAVAPGAERQGVGASLLHAFERAVATRSRHALLLVSDFNAPAQRFYERHGWARVGALPGLVLDDVAELIYWKRVRPRLSRT